jgi:transcriptional regulator with XRE-family HTH domain
MTKTVQQRIADLRQSRDERIKALRAKGWTLERIARTCGVTKQRVHQIVAAADSSR